MTAVQTGDLCHTCVTHVEQHTRSGFLAMEVRLAPHAWAIYGNERSLRQLVDDALAMNTCRELIG